MFYVKTVMKSLDMKYDEVVFRLKEINPNFNVRGGVNSKIDDNTFVTFCSKHDIIVDDQDNLIKYKSENNVKLASPEPVNENIEHGYNDASLNAFNSLKAEKIDPLKIKAEIEQLDMTTEVILEYIKNIPRYKTILTYALLKDSRYIKCLFNKYKYIIFPINLPFHIRKVLEQSFVRSFVTDKFNNRVIVGNEHEVLHAFIIEV